MKNKVYNLTCGFFFEDPRFNWRTESPSWLFLKNKNVNFYTESLINEYYYEFPQVKQYKNYANGGSSKIDLLVYDQNFSQEHPAGCTPNELVKESKLITKIYFKFYFNDGSPYLYISFTYQCNKNGTLEEKQYMYTLGDPEEISVFFSQGKGAIIPFDRWKKYPINSNVEGFVFQLPEQYSIGGYNCYTGGIDTNNLQVRNVVNFNSAIFNGLQFGTKWSYFETAKDRRNQILNFGFSDHEQSWQPTGPRYFYVLSNINPPGSITSDLKGF